MKYVRIENGAVVEIIPNEATIKDSDTTPSIEGIAYWYGADFAAKCVAAPDEACERWLYDQSTGTFSKPDDIQAATPTLEAQVATLQAVVDALIINALGEE